MPLTTYRPRPRLHAVLVMLALVLTAGAVPGVAPVPAHAAAAIDTGRLEFGLANGPGDLGWMTSSGVPWRYRYQYLSAGVNTGQGWETWQDPAKPPGQFLTDYIAASRSASYVPVFTYYELLQSTPSSGADEASRDLSNLANPSTMRSYYANFRLLMQRAGASGTPVVVHVEPDLWGYIEQHAHSQGAGSIAAAVTSSGDVDTTGIPDTAQGFAWALLRLRDRYAPNAVMSIHASMWGSGQDVASSTDPSLDPVAVGDATAAFLRSAGLSGNPYGSTWDAVFHDVDDHDAGWWEANGADNAGFTHWWDPTNTRFPNFARWLRWSGELHAQTGRPQVAWQVPVGNQHFLTENNTCGHYQDNVAQYVLAHPGDLRAAGIVAVLFGAGNGCQTTYTDAIHDGVTNNGGVPTTDAAGWCNACNRATSTWSDDDGGFLREAVAAYYGGAPPIATAPAAGPWGYWMVASDGGIFSFGDAAFDGSMGGHPLNAPIVGAAATPDGGGYWMVASDGGVFSFGDAAFHGSMGGHPLNAPVVGISPTSDGRGYWMVASDGGIFSFGDAAFSGSMGGRRLNAPIVGVAATAGGRGYWMVASDGGVFSFGDAAFSGSMGGRRLNAPIVGVAATRDGHGYRMVASDGGIFSFAGAIFLGSMGGHPLNAPIVAMATTPSAGGYWLMATDGGVFSFGDAPFLGSMGGRPLNRPVVGAAPTTS